MGRVKATARAVTAAGVGVLLATGLAARADETPAKAGIGKAQAGFALDLFRRVAAEEKGNVFMGPSSVYPALGMTSLGARGETQAAFAKTLGFPGDLSPADLHAAIAALGHAKGEGFALHSANALFGQKGYRFKKSFTDEVASRYGGGFREVDYRTAAEAARQEINGWVARETQDRIRDLVPPPLTSDTRLVLVNAVHFKAEWAEPFEKIWTKDAPFTLLDGKTVPVPLMVHGEHLDYAEDDAAQCVALPYKGGAFEALIVLPKEKGAAGLAAVEKSLTAANVAAWRGATHHQRVLVSLPRFTVTWTRDLAPDLKALGLGAAFSGGADFSGLFEPGAEPLQVDKVIHKAFLAVDENGTEAAAATAVTMKAGGMPEKPVDLRCDRPFFFLIRDKTSGAILFVTRLVDPRP